MTNNIIARIECYKEALETLKYFPANKDQLLLLSLFGEKLDELAECLGTVADFRSRRALKRAEAIIAKLVEWAKITGRFQPQSEATQFLAEAIDIAKEWQTQKEPKKFLGIIPRRAAKIASITFDKRKEISNGDIMICIAEGSSTIVKLYGEELESSPLFSVVKECEREMREVTDERERKQNELFSVVEEIARKEIRQQSGDTCEADYLLKSNSLLDKRAELENFAKLYSPEFSQREKRHKNEMAWINRIVKLLRDIRNASIYYYEVIQIVIVFANDIDALINAASGDFYNLNTGDIIKIFASSSEIERFINTRNHQYWNSEEQAEMREIIDSLNEEYNR